MPFATPEPDTPLARFADFINHEVIIEAQSRSVEQVESEYGRNDAVRCVIWQVNGTTLEPHRDVFVFNRAFIEALLKNDGPLGGTLKKERAYRLEPFPPRREEQIEQMWRAQTDEGGPF